MVVKDQEEYGLEDLFDLDTWILLRNEINRDWEKYELQENIDTDYSSTGQQIDQNSQQAKSRSREGFLSDGTITSVLKKWTTKVVLSGKDPTNMGSWSWIALRVKYD